jgi:hypothetical protein
MRNPSKPWPDFLTSFIIAANSLPTCRGLLASGPGRVNARGRQTM